MLTDLADSMVVVAGKDQFSCPLGETVVLLDMKAGLYFSLDNVGAAVWQLLQARVLLESMMPSRLAMARIYRVPPGSPRIYLYYPLRWVDLLARYGRQAWSLWRGDHRALDELRAVSERVALREWLA